MGSRTDPHPARSSPLAIVALTLALVCATRPARPADRFATPPWERDAPDWQRLDAKLPADHLARQINRAVEQLDWTKLFAAYADTGSRAHRPDLILKVVLYEIRRGRLSPAQWAEDFLLDEACQWLAGGVCPSRSRLYAFRDRMGSCLDGLNEGLIGTAVAEGLTQARQAALDGTTVAACASRHRLLNEETLATRQQDLAKARADEAAALADEAAATPAEDVPRWRATTPAGRQAQQERCAEESKQLYRRRGQTVELGFADVKEHRGLRRFHGRGLERAQTEVGLLVLVHNALAVLALRQEKSDANNAKPATSSA